MGVFGIIGSIIFFLFNLYNYKSLSKNMLLRRFSAILLLAFTLIFSFELAFFFRFSDTNEIAYEVAVYSLGFSFMAFCILLPCDLVAKYISRRSTKQRPILRFCFDSFVLITLILYVSYGVYNALYNPQITKRTVELKKLQVPLKIAVVSDTHLGEFLKKTYAQKIVDQINSIKPDMVFVVGDFVDTKASKVKDSLEPFKDLNSTYGTFYVVGNHEYYRGLDPLLAKISELNFNILQNTNLQVAGINVAGATDIVGFDFKANQPDFNATLSGINPNLPTILLSHQPRSVKMIDKELLNNVDLVLSGHTHGGQIFPFSLLVWIAQGYVYGEYKLSANTKLIVTSGAGFWGPAMRIGSKSEIVELNLVPAK